MLRSVTFSRFFAADRMIRWAEIGPLSLAVCGAGGRVLLVAGHDVRSAGIGGMGDSYPDLVDAAWANPC
jgi:hypothetical protein